MNSGMYTGWTTHQRVRPARNGFRYPVYFLWLDLDEIDVLDAELSRFSHNRRNIVSLWDVDHGPRDGTPLRPWIAQLVARAGVDLTGGRVMLLTFPRVLGTRFFPVSFWFCYDAGGEVLAILAEVQNTFRDRHGYLLHNDGAPFEWESRPTVTKAFYVSPFVQADRVQHTFTFTPPEDSLAIRIADMVEDSLMLTAAIQLTKSELSDAALVRTVWHHGPISAVALVRIHWQALRLWAKHVPFFSHTPAPAEEVTL